jgi:ribosomal protein S17E
MVDQLTKGATTRIRNQVAGYITHKYALSESESSSEDDLLDEATEEV